MSKQLLLQPLGVSTLHCCKYLLKKLIHSMFAKLIVLSGLVLAAETA